MKAIIPFSDVDRDIGELELACGLLENAHGDQLDFDDLPEHGAANPFGVILVEVGLLEEPLADATHFSCVFRGMFGVNPAPVFSKIERLERLV
ncbi:MAG: hypothetical protein WBV18_04845 [Methyloceanibacter sp.]|jgi:hypothetical protein|uniref:hypothetical protein n=1 Tax=Methyloceanibacter sp. TaxID=1965321 RepID=UPI003C6AA5FD